MLAVDYRCGDYVVVFRPDASDSNSLALKIDVSVADALIYAGEKHDDVAVIGIIYCCLNCDKVCPPIIVNYDYSGCAGDRKHQANYRNHDLHFHIPLLLHHIVIFLTGFLPARLAAGKPAGKSFFSVSRLVL
jgi:hypothetical protein